MNKRKAVISLAVILTGFSLANAESVSRKEAQQLAADFFSQAAGRVTATPKFVYNGKQLALDRLFTPFYVFNNPSGGFVIVAADNKAYPILAYSLTDSFDPSSLGPAQKALLSGYSREIEYIRLDERVPEEAIKAWHDKAAYINGILTARYDATDPRITPDEARERVHALAESYDAESYTSDIFTPSQWSEAIMAEQNARGSVAIGFPAAKGFPTAVVHGSKGDYFRIALDGRNNALYRLNATEFIASPQIAVTGFPRIIETKEEEEIPFEFYDSFIAEQKREAAERQARIENFGVVSEPKIHSIGAGHFDISFPTPITIARVYNLSGAQVATFRYGKREQIHIDLSKHPLGFYFVLANDIDGRPYGIKLIR